MSIMPNRQREAFIKHRALILMMVPGLAWFFIFRYLPMFGILIGFKEFNLMKGILGSPWANPWYKYFLRFFESNYFFQLIRNTLLISFGKLFWGMVPSILLALTLSECRNLLYKKVVQTVSYMPHFLSWVIIYALVYSLCTQNGGLINQILIQITGKPIEILSNPRLFRWIIYFTAAWQSWGWGAIVYLAAIAGIDPNLYDAAMMDGAGRLQRVWHVTIPHIVSVMVFMLIMRLGRVMDAGFEHIFVFYNPLVYGVGDIIDTWVFRMGLEQRAFSLAGAVGLFKSIIGCTLVLTTNRIAKHWGQGIW